MVRCFVDDQHLVEYLRNKAMLPHKSLLLVASEAPLDSFPQLCESYVCIHKDKIWSAAQSTIRHANGTFVKAYVDFLLASNAQTFYGNRFSSFSVEMVAAFRENGKTATFFNPILGPAA